MSSKTSVLLMALCLACGPAFGHSDHGASGHSGSDHTSGGQSGSDHVGGSHDGDDKRKISGVAVANFRMNEVAIPCVRVEDSDPSIDGRFFDTILEYSPSSGSFNIRFARVEDSRVCEELASYGESIDDDSNDDSLGVYHRE